MKNINNFANTLAKEFKGHEKEIYNKLLEIQQNKVDPNSDSGS